MTEHNIRVRYLHIFAYIYRYIINISANITDILMNTALKAVKRT